MNTYVMSDIHGCYDAFIEMLEKIEFSKNDQLVLAGDYIDRGPKSYEMLNWLEDAPDNILCLKGNHDAEFSQCIDILLSYINKFGIIISNTGDLAKVYYLLKESLHSEFFDYYGTLEQLILKYEIDVLTLSRWKNMIDCMPLSFKININGRTHIITHAGYVDKNDFTALINKYEDIKSFNLYAREDSVLLGGKANSTIISGHTPTISKGVFYNNGNVCKHERKDINCTFYNIDCGKAYYCNKYTNAKLACIRLEDKKVFYN